MFFGYMNSQLGGRVRHSDRAGERHRAGRTDQGQPTHFYPRRNPFLFTIRVPKDFGTQELIWTLTTNGKTMKAYASLKTDYQIDPQTISTEVGGDGGSLRDELRTNVAPELKVEGDKRRTVKVGQPVSLAVIARDPDNIPARRAPGAASPRRRLRSFIARSRRPSCRVRRACDSRGWSTAATRRRVKFSPEQMKTWTDSRAYANSPWSPPYVLPEPPPDNRWVATATFSEPGTYVLRGVASDGSLFTYDNVTVTVTR